MNFRDVPIPDRMKHLPLDRRGYPVFTIAARDANGVPLFTVNDGERVRRCVREKLCHICGTGLFRGNWFIGGPMSAFHEHGAYNDGPMHGECAHYALRVCPHLASKDYVGSIADVQGDKLLQSGTVTSILSTTQIPGKPPVFVAVMAIGHESFAVATGIGVHFRPRRPYRSRNRV
jgi:hypothetical protein